VTARPAHEVRDNAERHRYELYVDGRMIGIADYRPDGEVLVLPHTVIEPTERGKGWGEILVAAALDDIQRQGLRIVSQCWFVADFVGRNPRYADLVAESSSPSSARGTMTS
jgi:predicted GNAT family acetyltransferase